MNKMILLLVLSATCLIGCNEESVVFQEVEKEVIVEVEKPIEIEVEVEVEKPILQDWEGIYYLDNGSLIEILMGINGDLFIVDDNQVLLSINPNNDTFATHPIIRKSKLQVIGNTAKWTQNVNYSDGNDLEEDVNGSNIRGVKKTNFKFELSENGNITLTIEIYSDKINNNSNWIVATRVFSSL